MSNQNELEGQIYEPIEQRRLILHELIKEHIAKAVKGDPNLTELVLKDIDNVIDKGYSLDPVILNALNKAYARITQDPTYKHLKGFSIVLRGSVLNAGQVLRHALGTVASEGTDLDIVFTTDPNIHVDRETGRALNKVIQEQIDADLGHLKVEYKGNFDYPNFKDVKQVLKDLENVAATKKGFTKMTPPTPTTLNAVFLPSIPKEVNEQNKKLLIEGFKIFSKRSPDAFLWLKEMLFKDWNERFPIKFIEDKFGLKQYKHLYFTGMDDEDSKRAEKIALFTNELQTMRYRSIWNSIN